MSHTAKVVMQFKNPRMLAKAAKALGCPCEVGEFTEGFYEGRATGGKSHGNVKIQLPNWNYPVLIDTKTGDVSYDNYNGQWGDIAELNKLSQEYGLQIAEDEAQEFVLKGWSISRQKQPNGDIQLIIER